jgi:hypothetical protein
LYPQLYPLITLLLQVGHRAVLLTVVVQVAAEVVVLVDI